MSAFADSVRGRTLTASGWSPPGLGPLADYVRLDTSYLFNSRYCPGRHYPTPLTLSRRTLYASRYNILLSRRTLSASRYCPGGHNLLADSVRGHNLDENNCSISSKCCIIIYNKIIQLLHNNKNFILLRFTQLSPSPFRPLDYVNSTLQDAAFYTAVLFKTCQGHGLRGTVVRTESKPWPSRDGCTIGRTESAKPDRFR